MVFSSDFLRFPVQAAARLWQAAACFGGGLLRNELPQRGFRAKVWFFLRLSLGLEPRWGFFFGFP